MFSCEHCPVTFGSKGGLTRHTNSHFAKRFPCPYCEKTYRYQSYFIRHVAQMHKSQKVVTKVLIAKNQPEKKLYRPRSMVRYDNTIINEKKPVFVCKDCLTILLSENAARNHISECEGPKENQFDPEDEIDENGMIVPKAKALKVKTPGAWPDPTAILPRYTCSCCNIKFKRRVMLDKHIQQKIMKASMSDDDSSDEYA